MQSPQRKFKDVLEKDGLWSAMRWLNSTVPYRYSAVLAFEGDTLRNICLIDKAVASITTCDSQPITQFYCTYIHQTSARFDVEDASHDARVEGHPKRTAFQSYYGIPLYDAAGVLRGTVCHFDVGATRPTAEIAEVLDDVAPSIAQAAFTEQQ